MKKAEPLGTQIGDNQHFRKPNRTVKLLTGERIENVPPAECACEIIGQKAMGLVSLPEDWTLPFFVVSSDAVSKISNAEELQVSLSEAAIAAGLTLEHVFVRSNAVSETIADRGSLESQSTKWCYVAEVLKSLHAKVIEQEVGTVHWLIQNAARSHAQGQLSNERRISRENRDWLLEFEKGVPQATTQPIGVRAWRSGKTLQMGPLKCSLFLQISVALRKVAQWASQGRRRALLEWVWDGEHVWIVQMDLVLPRPGVKPASLLPKTVTFAAPEGLKRFRNATAADYESLRKLSNARMYSAFGYEMPPFYVLDAGRGLHAFLANAEISGDLLHDFEQLTKRSLVLRTDGSTLPPDKREMLPRSEELRNVTEVVKWLNEEFRPKCIEAGLQSAPLSLIGHHFIPSVSSAWARAEPGKRWVRVEALWGIPEGVYWHSHDTFEVDVETFEFSSAYNGTTYPYRSHTRYKGTYIAPNADGEWVYHQADDVSDWAPSITKPHWLREIAYTTRRIAEKRKAAVEVMWFVDAHPGATRHPVLPWYHSEPAASEVPVGTPRRRKLNSSQDAVVRTHHDWLDFKKLTKEGQRVERVLVEPQDSWLVRNLTFAEELGTVSAENNIVVVLAGGILSHAYHVLVRKGAHVECIDLYGTSDERVEYNKLVRDKIPDHIASRGEHYETIQLTGEALLTALRRKLIEEAFEALDASSGTDLIGELADVQEVLVAITKAVGSTIEDLETERSRKIKKRGGFSKGLMLQTTSVPRSLSRSEEGGPLVTGIRDESVRVVSNPLEIPTRARYRRPDRRISGSSSEDLLALEMELNRLQREVETVTYRSADGPEDDLIVETELKRHRSDLRVVIKVRKREREIAEQGKLVFEP